MKHTTTYLVCEHYSCRPVRVLMKVNMPRKYKVTAQSGCRPPAGAAAAFVVRRFSRHLSAAGWPPAPGRRVIIILPSVRFPAGAGVVPRQRLGRGKAKQYLACLTSLPPADRGYSAGGATLGAEYSFPPTAGTRSASSNWAEGRWPD